MVGCDVLSTTWSSNATYVMGDVCTVTFVAKMQADVEGQRGKEDVSFKEVSSFRREGVGGEKGLGWLYMHGEVG